MLVDPQRFCPAPIVLPSDVYEHVARRLDGTNTVEDLQRLIRQATSLSVDVGFLRGLIAELDRSLALEGSTFDAVVQRFRDAEERPAALAGRSYDSEPRRLAAELDRLFRSRGGAGRLALPAPRPAAGGAATRPRLRAVVSPHIDFERGGPVYTWAYKHLVEESDAEVFVILGVAHQYCRSRFVLTRKDFATPLGAARTDQAFVDALVRECGDHLFADELTHRTEHSIEFQAVFLKHVLKDRPFTIVPILVGSFHDLLLRRSDPLADPEIARFIAALREAERASGRKVAYIGGVDLCHVGPEFGDPERVDRTMRATIREFDRSLLDRAEAVDPEGWFRTAAEVGDRWRVCGLAATYTMLHAIGPSKGEVLRYDQAVDERGRGCVSFASMIFREAEPARA
ncbi:AmmeMemoRadiSam system protein B [Paludisphaera soli]|uniref:AmmeMemoRadiSam system protein B n=1 Tax=Paludisphaera soli TaxID=2712865 RepID=UPI001F0F5EAE|nr:AmmeMemoRadiSam system protein B [Paludisphaera soli]